MIVRCKQFNHRVYACLSCKHAYPHKPVTRRLGMRVELPCHEHGDYCPAIGKCVECISFEELCHE